MFPRRLNLPIMAVSVVLVTAVLVACADTSGGTDQAEPEVTAESTPASADDDDPPSPEVTRVVVETRVVEVTVAPSPTPVPQKELAICVPAEPETLYPYGRPRPSQAALHVLQAIYEPLYTQLSFDYQPGVLTKLPNLTDGDAVINEVQVKAGEQVLDVNNAVTILKEGTQVRGRDGEVITFTGEPLTLPQLVVRFSLEPLVWSDGEPVTAADSVYSFELAAHAETPVPKFAIERTASYRATGELTLEWTGVPGYLDSQYFTNVWTPLPEHVWGAHAPAELLQLAAVGHQPLGYGPYVVEEWIQGEQISLRRNNHYYRAAEGLPRVDHLIFRFHPDASQVMAALLAGECDIATADALGAGAAGQLIEAEQSGNLTAFLQPGTVFEHIDFGINPADAVANERADWFEDVRVRQAFVLCTDRQGMVDELQYGRSAVIDAYVPRTHPLFPADATIWPYDPAQANALFDGAGFLDDDNDGVRDDPATGRRFVVRLQVPTGNDFALQIAELFKGDLAGCGVEVTVEQIDGNLFFADGPEGTVFGRRFQLASFPWLISHEPNCALYLSTQIPAEGNNWNRSYNNNTGFTHGEFDAACQQALAAVPGMPEYEAGHQQALRIWTEQVPVIPLFMRLKVAAARPEVRHFGLDATQPTELWNLAELDLVQ